MGQFQGDSDGLVPFPTTYPSRPAVPRLPRQTLASALLLRQPSSCKRIRARRSCLHFSFFHRQEGAR